jgi:hypothetical protein
MAYEFVEIEPIRVIRGDTFDRTFEVSDDFPLSAGMKAKAQVREMADAEEIVLNFDTEDGSISFTEQDVQLSKPASAMSIPAKTYFFDVQFTSASGIVTTLFGGKMIVKEDYTI